MESSDQDLNKLNPKLVEFSRASDYGKIADILRKNSTLQSEKIEEALLLRGLCLEIVGRPKESKNCIMVSLILKYTRSLGPSGVDVFFAKYRYLIRLSGSGSSAQNLFFSDLDKTYAHISKRGKILLKEKLDKIKKEKEQMESREQLYKSFLQPDGTLKVPLGPEPTEMELKQAEWFDNLPEDYKRILF